MRRTKWNALAFLFSGALILAACGQQSGESAEPGGSDAAGGSQEPSAGGNAGTITMVVDGQITTLSNANADVPTANAYALHRHRPVPVRRHADPGPGYCRGPVRGRRGRDRLDLHAARWLTFHNGDPVTAADVVFTYELARSANCRFNPSVCLAPFLESVTAIDDTTIEFTLLEPYAPFATVILPGIFIDSEAVVTAAYDEFVGEASGADAADVTAAIDAITAATVGPDPEDAEFVPDPAACETAATGAETVLTAGAVELPSRDDFNTGGENADEFDPCAYATALGDLLSQLQIALEGEGIDAISATYPLLSFNTEPVGTGPFMCEPGCLAPGESLTLVAYDGFYDGAPETDTVVMPIITDDIQGANAVQAGQVDWKYSLTADSYEALKDDPNIKFAEYPDFGYYSLQYNLREGQLFADLGARKAVQYCIDKAATVEQATNGQGVPIEADIPPASWAYNPDLQPVTRDVPAAIGFLEEAGWTVEVDGEGNATGPATRGGRDLLDGRVRASRATGPHRVHGAGA